MDHHGNMIGEMSKKPINEPKMDAGVYSISPDDTFYFQWQHWDFHRKLCGRVFETKNSFIVVDCGNLFHTVYMKDNVQNGNHFKK